MLAFPFWEFAYISAILNTSLGVSRTHNNLRHMSINKRTGAWVFSGIVLPVSKSNTTTLGGLDPSMNGRMFETNNLFN